MLHMYEVNRAGSFTQFQYIVATIAMKQADDVGTCLRWTGGGMRLGWRLQATGEEGSVSACP